MFGVPGASCRAAENSHNIYILPWCQQKNVYQTEEFQKSFGVHLLNTQTESCAGDQTQDEWLMWSLDKSNDPVCLFWQKFEIYHWVQFPTHQVYTCEGFGCFGGFFYLLKSVSEKAEVE